MQSSLELAICGPGRRVHFKDGSSKIVYIDKVVYDIDGHPYILICLDSVIKWDHITHIDW